MLWQATSNSPHVKANGSHILERKLKLLVEIIEFSKLIYMVEIKVGKDVADSK